MSLPESLEVSSLLGSRNAGSLGRGLSSSSFSVSLFPILSTSSAATSSSAISSSSMEEAVEERDAPGVKGRLVGSSLILFEVFARARRWYMQEEVKSPAPAAADGQLLALISGGASAQ